MAEEKSVTQAVILAGGIGLRMRPYTYDTPKILVPVDGRPFMGYLLDLLKKNGIKKIALLTGYLHEKVKAYVGDGSRFGVAVEYSTGPVDHLTGTRLRNAKALLDERFLLLYCDNYLHFDLAKLAAFHAEKKALATMTVYTNRYGTTRNNVLAEDGFIMAYDRKREALGLNGVDTGFFIFEKSVIDSMPAENFWLEEVMLPRLIKDGKLAAFVTDTPYYSIGSAERLPLAERFLDPRRKVIFLDRDGVINKRQPVGDYVKNWKEFKFLPTVFDALALLKKHNYEIYIISNQAGVGRGLMTDVDVFNIHKEMERELKEHGISINGIYHCPHRADEGCFCRKPKPGMFIRAAVDYQIDLPRAAFVGDDPRDGEAGAAAGCRTVLMKSDGDLSRR